MARPRYQINAADWFDCLDWLDHQLQQPDWLHEPDHPIHSVGLSVIKECVAQWRDIDHPSDALCRSAQDILQESLTMEDWARMRKSLSARKRRRRERQRHNRAVNITLTPQAHEALTEFRLLSGAHTFSEALEHHLQDSMITLRAQHERKLTAELQHRFQSLTTSVLLQMVEDYLELSQHRRSLANACKIAHQLYRKRPERDTLRLVRDRFIEDLVWNDTHLKVNPDDLGIIPATGESA